MNALYQGNSNHQNSLEVGHEFQDFITEKLAKEFGIAITIFQSKKYQFQKGESLQGVEIKYDARSTGDCTYTQRTATGNVGMKLPKKVIQICQNLHQAVYIGLIIPGYML